MVVVDTLDFSMLGAAALAAVDSAGIWEGISLTRECLADFFPDVYGRKTFLQKRDEIPLHRCMLGARWQENGFNDAPWRRWCPCWH
jgi:hypothetical protein